MKEILEQLVIVIARNEHHVQRFVSAIEQMKAEQARASEAQGFPPIASKEPSETKVSAE